jgi:polyamine oxidase
MRFEGDAIINTCSVGVLKKDYIKHNPPLPGWKKQALDEIEMGNYVKIFCRFKAKFWGEHEYVFIADKQKGKYPQWMPEKK